MNTQLIQLAEQTQGIITVFGMLAVLGLFVLGFELIRNAFGK